MIYLHINKANNEPSAFGSVVALCQTTGLKKSVFYYHFGVKKMKILETDGYKVYKLNITRAK